MENWVVGYPNVATKSPSPSISILQLLFFIHYIVVGKITAEKLILLIVDDMSR